MVDDQGAMLGGGLRVLQREARVVGDVLGVSHRTLERFAEPRDLFPNLLRGEVFVFLGALRGGKGVENRQPCPDLEQAFATEHGEDEREVMDEVGSNGP